MIGAMFLLAALGLQEADPLAPAARREMQCYTPDPARKTCRAMAGYARQSDGTYLNTAHVLIDRERDITLEVVSPVYIVDGAVCGRLDRASALAGKIRVAGQLQPDAVAAPILSFIADTEENGGMFRTLICTRYVPDGDGFKAIVSVDGVHDPALDDRVIWVRPDQGFRVAG